MKFHIEIWRLRKDAGWNQRRTAASIGRSQAWLSLVERGLLVPRLEDVLALRRVLLQAVEVQHGPQ